MPIFGENIGRAYVEVIASGDGLDESIRREFHDSEPSVREGGRRHGIAYGEEYDRALREDWEKRLHKTQGEMFDDLNHALSQNLQRLDLGRQWFDSPNWKKFRSRLEHEFGDAGALAGRDLEREFGDNFDINRLTARMNQIGPDVRRAQAKILNDMHSDALRMNREFDQALSNQQSRLMRLFREYEQELGRMERGEKGVRTTRQGLIDDFGKLRGLFSSMGPSMSHMGDDFTDIDRRLGRLDTTTTRWRGSLQRTTGRIDEFGNAVGRMFGLGSRNNFFNIFGSIIGAGVKLPSMFTRIGDSVLGMVDKFQELRQAQGLMGAIGITAAQGVAGIIALAAALVVLSLIIGPLISLLIGLVGILLALASSVAFAAAAVGGVLLGALGPLALGLGVTIAAVIGLKKHAGDLAPQLKALKNDFSDLAQVAKDAAFARLPQQMNQLHGILQGLNPLVRATGHGISIMIDELLGAFRSRAFIQFRNTFEKAMPGIMRRLGSITANAFEGLFGLFRALLPLVQRFLGWLDSITGQFARWVNSSRGQNAVQDFFDRAAHSAQELGGFIAACVGLISDLVDSGQGAGDSMFASLTDKINEFRDFLQQPVALKSQPQQFGHMGQSGAGSDLNIAPPETKTRLDQFYTQAHKLAGALGDAAVAAGKLMGAFNNKDSQDSLRLLIGLTTSVLGLLGAIQRLTGGIMAIPRHLHDAFNPKNWIPFKGFSVGDIIHLPTGAAIAKMIGKIDIGGLITGGAKAAGKLVGDFAGTGKRVFDKVKTNVSGMISGAASAASKLVGAFVGTAGKVLAKVKTNVSGMIDGAASAVGHLISSFSGVPGRVLSNVRTNVGGMISGAATAASHLVDAFRGLAGRIVSAIGTIVPHISLPTIHVPHIHLGASGGMFDRATPMIIGEAGREALVPLDRPLDQVDPAVRELSAFAQGLRTTGRSSQSTGASKNVHNEITVVTPTTDPHAVAVETVNYLTAVGGY